MKNFFYFSLSVALLTTCALCGLLYWNSEKEKQAKTVLLQEKRERLHKYYVSEIRVGYQLALDSSMSREDCSEGRKIIEDAEQHMLQDGYDRAQIEDIKFNCRDVECQRLANLRNNNKTNS